MVCFKKKLEPIELCASVHCPDAESTPRIPVSFPLATNGDSQSLQNLNSNVDQRDFHSGTHLTRCLRSWRLVLLPLRRMTFRF